MKKLVSGIIFSLLIINMLTLTSNTQPVKAWTGSVKILENGSVSPSTAPIQRSGNLYTLTDNISSSGDHGIAVLRDNIILDGAGYTLQGTGDNSGVWLFGRKNITIRNMKIKWFFYGIFLYGSSYINISGNNIAYNNIGINFYSTSNSIISRNNITENTYDGVSIDLSSYNSIIRNNITENTYGNGIRLYSSKYIVISGNDISNNWSGIGFFVCTYNSIVGNSITGNDQYGVWLYDHSSNNTIGGNTIDNNHWGIYLDNSSNNVIYHNNFVNNSEQVITINSLNVWDDDYPSGGNYWSNYVGVDSDDDGIGDTPYIIDSVNRDRYPHMYAWSSTIYLLPSTISTEVGMTFSVNIVASGVQNLWAWQAGIQWNPAVLEYVSYTWGEFQAYAGASRQSSPTIDSVSGKTSKPALESALRGWFAPVSAAELKLLTITFKAIKAGDSPLKLIDVSFKGQNSTDTTAYPRWSDVNGDGVINDIDVTLTYECWEGGHYDQIVDFNNDGVVDITDISIVTSDFGKDDADPEWGITNTIYDVPVAIVSAHVQVKPSEAYVSVPYHPQITSYFCGPAALEMVFDFYGPDIGQVEIADVARTTPDGTYTFDMIRASHFSNLSLSPAHIRGYTRRKLGYAAFDCGGMTMDDLKSLITMGYPVIVLVTWHFRVAVGYNSTHITFQDSLRGPMYNKTYSAFDTEWDYSGHWGLFISPWNIKVSNVRNVLPGDVINIEAEISYPCPSPFSPSQYPATQVNATITLPDGLGLVPGEVAKKTVTDYLTGGESTNVMWMVQVQSLGNYAISVEAEGKVNGFVPPLPDYPENFYEDRIGGVGQSLISVTSPLDESPPTTSDDYDGVWRNQNFKINLTAEDDNSGVMETYYRINNGLTKTSSLDGQPYITTESTNNTLEYWSVDWVGNEEFPHKFLLEIKLDKTKPIIGEPSRIPSDDVLPSQEVKVAVDITDATSGVKNVTLFYTVNNGITWKNRIMNYNLSTSLYEATIPCQPDLTVVKFKIVAYDNVGNMAVKDNSGKYYSYQVKAVFKLTITTTSGGTTSPAPGTYFYQSGIMIGVDAIPNSGYKLDYWRLDNVKIGSANSTTVLMNKNHTLRAVFMYTAPPPVGGFSFLIEGQMTQNPLTLYLTITAMLAAVFTVFRRKRCERNKLKDYIYNLLRVCLCKSSSDHYDSGTKH